jgi:hypothetical protein
MSFKDQTLSFFDELTAMLDEQQKGREEQMDAQNTGQGPYSNLLTQDETPTETPPPEEQPEPEVITRATE